MIGAFQRVLGILEEEGVRFVVVGGVAVVMHGFLRLTSDLDLMIDLEPGNTMRAVKALARVGYRPRAPVDPEDFADAEIRSGWVRDKGMQVFSMWHPGGEMPEVDLFATELLPFGDAHARAASYPLETASVKVLAIEDLIELKVVAGRRKDLDDVDALRAILAEKAKPRE